MNAIVTTSLRMDDEVVSRALDIASNFRIDYVSRNKRSIASMLTDYPLILVVYKENLIIEQRNGRRFFFHPDTAILRLKSKRDPLLELLGSSSKTILDCTMGLASDSLVMAGAGHQVTAVESSLLIHFLVTEGLRCYDCGDEAINRSMRSIQTVCIDAFTYLKSLPSDSVDVVYFDPMFSEEIVESHNLAGLSLLAETSPLTIELFDEARRVARIKVIFKGHFRDSTFEEFGFQRIVRPNQKFHYGEIILEENDENFSNRF